MVVEGMALLEDGQPVAADAHPFTGAVHSPLTSPLYALTLPRMAAGRHFTLQVTLKGYAGTSCAGTVFLTPPP